MTQPTYQQLTEALIKAVDALPDPLKLNVLAAWFDCRFSHDPNPEVQTDLRKWANKINEALNQIDPIYKLLEKK